MKFINISYSANTRSKDIAVNLQMLLMPWKWKQGDYIKKMQQEFEKNFPDSKVYIFNYARSGMYVLFKSLNLQPSQNQIIVQGFTCIAAVNPIIWAKGQPVYCDIDETTCNLSIESVKKALTKNVKAIMFQHTFGNSKNIEEIKELCDTNNLLLIEDCANTIYGKHKNKLVGSFGDAAIFSFGRDKAISGVNGGIIVVHNKKLIENFEKEYSTLDYPSTKWIFQQLVFQPIWAIVKTTYKSGLGKLIHLIATKFNLLTRATSIAEKKGEITKDIPKLLPNALAKLAYIQYIGLEEFNKHRTEISDYYKSEIKSENIITYENGNILLRFPVKLAKNNSEKKQQIIDTLLKKEYMQIGDWYDKPITPSLISLEKLGYKNGSCPKSEKMAKVLINLPTHINITKEDAVKIIKALKEQHAI